jgi:hypothetical protein
MGITFWREIHKKHANIEEENHPVKHTVPNDMSNDMSQSKIFDTSSDMSLYMSGVMTVDIYLGMSNNMSKYRSFDMIFDIH